MNNRICRESSVAGVACGQQVCALVGEAILQRGQPAWKRQYVHEGQAPGGSEGERRRRVETGFVIKINKSLMTSNSTVVGVARPEAFAR